MPELTLEALEALAEARCAEAGAEKARLAKIIRAYAQMIAAQKPKLFRTLATEYGDEAGDWDNSFPPDMVYRNFTGPRAIKITPRATEDIPLEKKSTTAGAGSQPTRACTSAKMAPSGAAMRPAPASSAYSPPAPGTMTSAAH